MNRLENKKQTRSDSENEATGLSVAAVGAQGVEDAEASKVAEVMRDGEAMTQDAEETQDPHLAEEVLRTVELHHAVKQTPGFPVVAEHTG